MEPLINAARSANKGMLVVHPPLLLLYRVCITLNIEVRSAGQLSMTVGPEGTTGVYLDGCLLMLCSPVRRPQGQRDTFM